MRERPSGLVLYCVAQVHGGPCALLAQPIVHAGARCRAVRVRWHDSAEYDRTVVQVYDELEKRAIVPSMTGAAALRDSEAGSDCTRSDINVQARTPGHTPDGCSSSEGRLSE